jgi:hypothetical protein
VRYEIRIENGLDSSWTAWFDDLHITTEPDGVTVIAGTVVDQAALHGLLTKIRDLGLTMIAVRRLPPDGHQETRNAG